MKHGGDLSEAVARLGGEAADWLDLSTGINPHPWPMPASLPDAVWTRLPGRGELDGLLAAARQAYGVPPEAAIVGAPGAQALIQWLPRIAPPGRVAILGPTYSEHAVGWRQAGLAVQEVGALDDIAEGMRHAVVVNPNNPDGRIVPQDRLLAAADRRRAASGWLIVDESFADVAPACSMATAIGGGPAIVLRSFGKFYGLAGLRLGFALAPPAIAAQIELALGPWALSGPAIAIGRAALADRDWATAMRARLAIEAQALDALLKDHGLTVVGGTHLFRLARHPDAPQVHQGLAERRIWVRRFDWAADLLRFGLPPNPAASERLRAALGEIMAPL